MRMTIDSLFSTHAHASCVHVATKLNTFNSVFTSGNYSFSSFLSFFSFWCAFFFTINLALKDLSENTKSAMVQYTIWLQVAIVFQRVLRTFRRKRIVPTVAYEYFVENRIMMHTHGANTNRSITAIQYLASRLRFLSFPFGNSKQYSSSSMNRPVAVIHARWINASLHADKSQEWAVSCRECISIEFLDVICDDSYREAAMKQSVFFFSKHKLSGFYFLFCSL